MAASIVEGESFEDFPWPEQRYTGVYDENWPAIAPRRDRVIGSLLWFTVAQVVTAMERRGFSSSRWIAVSALDGVEVCLMCTRKRLLMPDGVYGARWLIL